MVPALLRFFQHTLGKKAAYSNCPSYKYLMISSSNAQDHRFEASYHPSPLVSQDVVYSTFFTWKAALNVEYVLFSTAHTDIMIVLVVGDISAGPRAPSSRVLSGNSSLLLAHGRAWGAPSASSRCVQSPLQPRVSKNQLDLPSLQGWMESRARLSLSHHE